MTPLNPDEFRFHTKYDLTVLLGKKARNVGELLEGLKIVPEASVYWHTHKFLEQHHYLSPEPPNDFAYWVTNVLNEKALGEKISSVDIIQYRKISDLRRRFIEILEDDRKTAGRQVDAPGGQEFYFMASQTFVLPTPYVPHNLKEFTECLKKITINSLYYHIFDSRLRLERGENDFSAWFRKLGYERLADSVKQLDPYTQTLEGLRNRIIQMVGRYAQD